MDALHPVRWINRDTQNAHQEGDLKDENPCLGAGHDHDCIVDGSR